MAPLAPSLSQSCLGGGAVWRGRVRTSGLGLVRPLMMRWDAETGSDQSIGTLSGRHGWFSIVSFQTCRTWPCRLPVLSPESQAARDQTVRASRVEQQLLVPFFLRVIEKLHARIESGRKVRRQTRTNTTCWTAGVSYAWDDRTLDRRLEPTSAPRRAEAAAAGPRPPRPTVPAPATLVCSTGRGPVQ